MQAFASIETPNAKRYLSQFCKHFAHKTEVELADSNEAGAVTFSIGICRLHADATTLTLALTPTTPDDKTNLQSVVERHLIRFAFREDIAFTWHDTARLAV
jgi:hypothetical protein